MTDAELIEKMPDALLARAEKAEAEVERLRERNAEWERKASSWMASPEAAQRLDGYRELAQQLNAAEAERDALRAALTQIDALCPMDCDGMSEYALRGLISRIEEIARAACEERGES